MPQVIRTSSFFRHSTPVRLGLFVLRHSKRSTHLDSSAAHDNDCAIQQEETELVFGERYFAVHDGPVHCLFNSQRSAGKFRPLSHYS
jgi:hypothetical protein